MKQKQKVNKPWDITKRKRANRQRLNKTMVIAFFSYCTLSAIGFLIMNFNSHYSEVQRVGAIVQVAHATEDVAPISIEEQIIEIVSSYFPNDVEYLMAIQACENRGMNPSAQNPILTSSGNAVGIWQITSGTWSDGIKRFRPHWSSEDIKDPLKNTEMAMEFIKAGELWRWECVNLI